MKFIFPKNYNFTAKLFGFIDYSTAIFNLLIAIFIYSLLKLFIKNISTLIPFFITLYFPFFLFSILNTQKESFLSTLKYLLRYLISSKLYLYIKKSDNFF